MRTVCAFLLASLVPAAASAQPHAFAVWERPAAGVFVGASGNGDYTSRGSGGEAGLVFDTPVVFGYRLRADASRVAWRFGTRDDRGGLHGVAGLESISPGPRYAVDLEVRIHAIDGTGQPPVLSMALFKLDAAIGMKVRF